VGAESRNNEILNQVQDDDVPLANLACLELVEGSWITHLVILSPSKDQTARLSTQRKRATLSDGSFV
jgi:hypothetical protein